MSHRAPVCMYSLILACAMLHSPARARAQAAAEPPEAIRRTVEDHAVMVRVWDEQVGQSVEVGSGFIVADDGNRLTVVTAEHVVEPGRAGRSRVELRFVNRDAWISARLHDALRDAGGKPPDLAALSVERAATPFGPTRLANALIIAPSPKPGERVWAYGFDTQNSALAWRSGFLRAEAADSILFDAERITPGFSGGVLVAPAGPIGLLQESGSRGLGHTALAFSRAAQLFAETPLPFDLQRNAPAEALAWCLQNDLTVAIYVVDHNMDNDALFWAGVRVTQTKANEFAGEAITGEARVNVRFRAEGRTVIFGCATPLEWLISGHGPRVPADDFPLELHPATVIPGFVVLRGVQHRREVYVAIPRERAEMFVSRLLVSAAGEFERSAVVPRELAYALHGWVSAKADAAVPVFALFCTRQVFNHPNEPASGFVFKLPPGLHRDKPVRLTGRRVATDWFLERPGEERAIMSRRNLQLVDVATDKQLAQAALGPPGPLDLSFQPTDKAIRLQFSLTAGDGRAEVAFLLQDLVLRYSPP